jgi:hypothetical protein
MFQTGWFGFGVLLALVGSPSLGAAQDTTVAVPAQDSGWWTSVKLSGFVTASYTYSNNNAGSQIVGRLYDRLHDQAMLNAVKLVVAKQVATDKYDAGFEAHALFGQNASVIQAAGLSLGNQGDVTQAFATLNIPAGAEKYVQFRAGKIATLMGLEVIEDPVNPNLSEGNQFIYVENFTNTGLRMDARVSPSVDLELMVLNGWDVVADNNTKKSFMGRVGLAPTPTTSLALLGFAGNEKPAVDGVTPSGSRYGGEVLLTQKAGSSGTVYLQGDYGEEQDLPAAGLKATWWAAGLWATYDLRPKLGLALRGDYVDDKNGARTSGVLGFAPAAARKFGSATATLNIKQWNGVLIRPEVRYDRSDQSDFGAANDKKDQVSFALGVSYLF